MSNDVQVSIRVPADVPTRAERVAARLAERPEYQGLRLARATALRIAMLRGLDVLEAELESEPATAPKPKGEMPRI